MLVHPRLERVGFALDDVAVEVDTTQEHRLGTKHLDVQAGDRQAAFVVHPLPGRLDDLRVEDHLAVAFAEVPDEDLLLHTDLWSGERQPETGVVQRREHVVDEAHQFAVDVGDGRCLRLEHRVPEGANLVRHGVPGYRDEPGVPVSHYFDERPAITSDVTTVDVALHDVAFTLTTDRGVFSHGHVDTGTLLLLQSAPQPPAAGDLLDLGCGAGPISLALAKRSPAATVWALDVNERARALTEANAARNGVPNVRVVAPEDVPADIRFAAIWSNPPIRIGKQALHTLLVRWMDRLDDGGTAILVVQKHLGADSLQRWLTAHGYPTERIASRAGFRLLRSERTDPS